MDCDWNQFGMKNQSQRGMLHPFLGSREEYERRDAFSYYKVV